MYMYMYMWRAVDSEGEVLDMLVHQGGTERPRLSC
jgi:transposase-like protein